MAVFNSANLNAPIVIGNLQQKLKAHRDALQALANLYAVSSGVAAADLVAIGFSAADAATYLAALADAHAEYLIYLTGLPPSTYPQPGTAYLYATSQNQVLGLSGP